MQLDAFKMVCDETKKGEDTKLFKEVVQKIDGRLGPDYGLDLRWIEAVDYEAELKREKLEKTISDYLVIRRYIIVNFNDMVLIESVCVCYIML